MYFIRQMVQWKREDISAFDSTAVAFARSVSPILYKTKDQFTTHQISNKIKPYTGISLLTNNNWKDFDAKQYLYFSDNRIHAAYIATSTYRNLYLLQLIEKQLKLHDRIFIMIGFDHAKEVAYSAESGHPFRKLTDTFLENFFVLKIEHFIHFFSKSFSSIRLLYGKLSIKKVMTTIYLCKALPHYHQLTA